MKANYALYGILFLCVVFAGVMGYMYYADRAASGDAPLLSAAQDSGRPVSGRPGKLVIGYAGDINGQLGPCG
jgi:hypothetical protein